MNTKPAPSPQPQPTLLPVAGSDSCRGAGIQVDLKTFTTLGVYGMSVLTAVTAQSTLGVQGAMELPPHGSGCAFSAAIAAELAKGRSAVEAVRTARKPIAEAIRASFSLCRGTRPVNVLAWGRT